MYLERGCLDIFTGYGISLDINIKMNQKLSQQLYIHTKEIVEKIKALADFLEYLFLIQDKKLQGKYKEYKENIGGASNMSIDEIRKMYYQQKGIEQGIEQGIEKGIEQGVEKRDIEIVLNMLSEGINEETISKLTRIDVSRVLEIKEKYKS